MCTCSGGVYADKVGKEENAKKKEKKRKENRVTEKTTKNVRDREVYNVISRF